ncbi:hypothetical protein ACH4E7_39040 [Kitasatospora sp. NPDC018058]|uniref:hypothetical protein n=1 Tax=Kitasatospora sp. NPDC018058 TaxID=3364025 RepID=UPI0037C0DA7C
MYLIHVRLALPDGFAFPSGLRRRLLGPVSAEATLDHVTLHPAEQGVATLGLFVTAPTLASAEAAARSVGERVLVEHAGLTAAALMDCQAVLVDAFFERLLAARGGGGRTMPPHDWDIGRC